MECRAAYVSPKPHTVIHVPLHWILSKARMTGYPLVPTSTLGQLGTDSDFSLISSRCKTRSHSLLRLVIL